MTLTRKIKSTQPITTFTMQLYCQNSKKKKKKKEGSKRIELKKRVKKKTSAWEIIEMGNRKLNRRANHRKRKIVEKYPTEG